MKIVAAGLVILTALTLAGCSQENATRMVVRFRDRVVADAASAEALRNLENKPQDTDSGYGYYRADLRHEQPKPATAPAADGKTNPDGSTVAGDPTAPPKPFEGQSAAPPVVYYYTTTPGAAAAPSR